MRKDEIGALIAGIQMAASIVIEDAESTKILQAIQANQKSMFKIEIGLRWARQTLTEIIQDGDTATNTVPGEHALEFDPQVSLDGINEALDRLSALKSGN